GDPQSDDMEGKDVWDLSVPETLTERAHQIDLIRRRHIAVLDGTADCDYLAAVRAATEARARAEAALATQAAEAAEATQVVEAVQAVEEGELLPSDSNDDSADLIWLDENVWTEPFRIPFINMRAPLPQPPPPKFIPGHGFATYPVCPAIQAPPLTTSSLFSIPPVCALSRVPLQCLRPRPRSPSPKRPDTCSPLLMVLCVKALQSYFPDYLAELTLEEFGRPPYTRYLQPLLAVDFLHLLTEPESVPVPPVSVEATPVPVPVSESEESSIVIEWDDQQPLIELVCSSSESAQSFPVPLSIDADPTTMPALCAAHRPAPTNRLTEQNSIRRALPEPLPIACYRLLPFHSPERLEDVLPIVEFTPQTALITDNHSPLYNANGYTVFHVTATSARLSFSLTPEPHFRFHRNARLMHHSETEGILMRFPL
ncbi:MAG: hypothetical protein GY847_22925, partial [Proteobacteria bacterium]|nr:hypothetical protein [Pseudomonadota bacterium]